MHPRILLRTHYQADEPRTILATVTECTSPTESRNEDAIAAAVVRWARENEQIISIPGAVYAVGNARSLEFLNKSNRWTATGLAFGYIHKALPVSKGIEGLVLTWLEERLYLRHYMAKNGALVIKFGQWLLKHGSATDEELRNRSVIEGLMVEALDEYLAIATDIRDRTAIRRERDRMSRSEYASSTKRHKRYPLLTTMERLRLLDAERANGDRQRIAPDGSGRLATLLTAIPDIRTLERLGRDDSLHKVVSTALRESSTHSLAPQGRPATVLADAYRYAVERGLQACPLAYLDDVLYAYFGFDAHRSTAEGSAEELLEPLHRALPGEVRFHVDRRGRRAFVLITDRTGQNLDAVLSSLAVTPSS